MKAFGAEAPAEQDSLPLAHSGAGDALEEPLPHLSGVSPGHRPPAVPHAGPTQPLGWGP